MTKEFGYSAKPFFGQSFSPTARRIVKLHLFIGSILCLYLLYRLLTLIAPPVFAFLIILSIILRILIEISRIITFPGAYWFWRRNTENYFQSVSLLMKLLDYLEQEVAWDNLLSEVELSQIRMMISSLLGLLNKQEEQRSLSRRQRKLLQDITEIEQLLNETQIVNKADQKVFSLWSLLEENSDAQDGLLLPNALLYYQERNQGNILFERCQRLENRLNDITIEKGFFGSLKRWLMEDTFGTIDQVREEIISRYECKKVSLQVDKKASLDCLFIAGRSNDEADTSTSDIGENEKPKSGAEIEGDSNYYLQYAAKGTKHLKTTIIICCPHTAYYEYLFYENEWIDLYIRNGLNVFLWNYRGYGRSKGSLNSHILKKDGEFIVDYLRKEMGVKRLGAHGESIGGLVASHLARNKNLDYLCVDRNFADFNRIGEIQYGRFIGGIYKHLMMWDEDIGSNYLESSCYKVITFDPKDETIPLMDSLTYALTCRMIANKENFENEDSSAPSFFSKLKRFRKLQAFNKKIEESIQEYYELLSREQMIALFWALFRISELFDQLSSIQNLPGLAKGKRAKSIDDISVAKLKNVPAKLKYERRNSLDSSINMSVLKENEHDPHNLEDRPNSPTAGGRKGAGADESMLNDSKYLNETIDMREFGQLDDAHLVKTAKRKGYGDQFEEGARNSPEVIGFLVKIFAAFEYLEAGGIQVTDILSLNEEIRFEAFMHFINSLEVWGSYYPLEKIVEDEPKSITYYQASALNKLKEFVKRVDLLIQKQKLKPIDRGQNKLVNAVLDDLEIITSVIPTLFQKISMRNEETSLFVTGEGHQTQDDVQIDIEDASRTKDAVGGKFIALGSHTSRNTDRSQSYAFLGNLLPLGLGHSESLKQEEIDAYEYHLKNSKMI